MKKWLKTYFPFSKATVQAHILAYPFETFMYFFGMTVGIFVVYYIWKVIYQTGGYDLLEGFTFNEMIAYVVLSFTAMQVTDNGTVWIIADEIRSGNIIMNLIKPLNYHMRIFAEVSGITGFLTLVMIVPVSLITIFSFKIGSIPMFVAFLLSLFLGVVISFLFDFIFGMLAFYVKNLWGIGFGKFALVRLLSGALIPLVFFPKPIQNILNLLPFKGMIYTPVMIFLGKYQSQEMLMSMMNQVLWIGILALCNYLLWRKAVTRLTVQGG